MPSVLITVTHNSSDDLSRHWGSTDRTSRWIVADNASSDDSAEVARALGADVIRMPSNVGFSGANNRGAAESNEDCLIFVNPDVTVSQAGIDELTRIATERNALVAPQLLNADGTSQENGRNAPYLYRKFLHFFGSSASQDHYEVFAGAGELKPITWAIGAAIAIPRSIFDELGGWDAGFFIYYEDSDICLRARAAGHEVLLAGSVRWTHGWARATRRRFSWEAWKFEFVSAARFYRRYPGLLLHPRIPFAKRPAYVEIDS